MFELPRRESEIRVEFSEGTVALVFEPLTDAQYLAVNEVSRIEKEGDQEVVIYRTSRIPGLFEDRLCRVEGVAVDGQPFDRDNPLHMERIPQPWKAISLTRLVRSAMGLTEGERGNSKAPAVSSPEGETPSTD